MNKSIRRDDWQSLKPTIFGFGIVDVNYVTQKMKTVMVDGKRKQKRVWVCPYYERWVHMIRRCHSKLFLERNPTYEGCTVCDEWKYLSKFIEWVDNQPNKEWYKCELDKDFLINGNKVYSPETVVFISGDLNCFITERGRDRGGCMIGVSYRPDKGEVNPYYARCCNPLTRKRDHIGCYPTELDAHKAWQESKHQYALQLADQQSDPRIAAILRERYSPDKDWTNT